MNIPLYGPLVVALPLAPFALISLFLRSKRKQLTRILWLYLGGAVLITGLIIAEAFRFSTGTVPGEIVVIGPSDYSIRTMILPIIATTVWLPVLLVGGLSIILRKALDLTIYPRITDWSIFTGAASALLWTLILCFFCEFLHEDSRWAQGFAKSKWDMIEPGMHKGRVYQIIGEPLEEVRPGLEEDSIVPECWAVHQVSGYFAAIWFTNDVVREKRFWWMD